MKETSYLTDAGIVTGSGGIATTIGKYLLNPPAARPIDFGSVIYIDRPDRQNALSFGETTMPQESQSARKVKPMGDKSPKSNQKKSTQKQSKASSADQQKKQAVAAKQAAGKKK